MGSKIVKETDLISDRISVQSRGFPVSAESKIQSWQTELSTKREAMGINFDFHIWKYEPFLFMIVLSLSHSRRYYLLTDVKNGIGYFNVFISNITFRTSSSFQIVSINLRRGKSNLAQSYNSLAELLFSWILDLLRTQWFANLVWKLWFSDCTPN